MTMPHPTVRLEAGGEPSSVTLRSARLGPAVRRSLHVVHVATVTATFRASPDRIFRVLKGVAEGHGGELEWAEVVDRSGSLLLCDFWTKLDLPFGRSFLFSTREMVELDPPAALHYRHLSGPSRGLAESMVIQRISPGTTKVTYRAVFPSPWRWFGYLFALLAKPVAHVFMQAHFRELRRSVERAPADRTPPAPSDPGHKEPG